MILLPPPFYPRYEGDWIDDVMHGKGVLQKVEGGKYRGEFWNGLRGGVGSEVSRLLLSEPELMDRNSATPLVLLSVALWGQSIRGMAFVSIQVRESLILSF
jgi:hypothetical protein